MLQKLLEFLKEKGQGIVEYAMILGFVAVIAIALLSSNGLQQNVSSAISNVDTVFTDNNTKFTTDYNKKTTDDDKTGE